MWAPDSMDEKPPSLERINDPQELLAKILECIDCKDGHGLKTYILEHKLKDYSIIWELILKLGECINAEKNENEQTFFDVCNRCLLYLIKVGNPKETLLAILEQMDTSIDDVKYRCFLPLIQTALLKIPSKLFHSLDIALETVSAHIQQLPLPENVQLEGDEIKVFHMDKDVVRLVDNLDVYLDFLDPFVKAIDLKRDRQSNSFMQQGVVLKKHLLKIFDHPLCHLILTRDESVKSNSRLCAEQAMTYLAHLETNLYRLLQNAREEACNSLNEKTQEDDSAMDEQQDNDENERKDNGDSISNKMDILENWDFKLHVSHAAKACIAYLIHHEHLGINKFPSIFSHQHILEVYLDSLSLFLEDTTYPVNMKGLLLAQSLIKLVPKGSLTADAFDNPAYLMIINNLITIMTKCPVRDHRKLATDIFPQMIVRFDSNGRYKMYMSILSTCTHSGVKGFVITGLKNDIASNLECLKENKEAEIIKSSIYIHGKNLNQYFIGKSFHKLLLLAFKLPEKETSDMLENSDQIISGINLLRFLVLADPASANLTKFWDVLSDVQKQFITPLWRGLELSKAHYKLEQENVNQGKSSSVGAQVQPNLSVSVGGSTLPSMEKKEKLELIGKALNTHDIMLGLLGRLSELIDQNKLF